MNRANNVIVSGLPENNLGTVQERHQHDVAEIRRVLNFLEISVDSISECTRIGGRVRGGSRLLKVNLKDPQKRDQLLRKSRSLRGSSEFGKIFINPDLTASQQQTQKILRRELEERRQLGESVVIYAGSVRPKSSITNFRKRF